MNKDCNIIVHGLSTDVCNLISFYSKDKEFISGYSGLQYHNITVEIQKDDFPSNAEYVRVSGQGNDTDFLINMSLGSLISYINNDYKEARVEKLRLKVIDYSEYSTIKVSGGTVIHLNNNRKYSLPTKDFNVNNYELLYIDIDSESPDILTANYIDDWVKLYNRNILVLAYRDSERVTGGLLYEKYILQNIDNVESILTENVDYDLTENHYININGQVLETSSNSGYSNPIELFRGETIRVYASGSPVNSIISVTDSKGLSYRSAVASVGGGLAWYEYTAIEDCYVAVSFVINDRNKVVKDKFVSGVKGSDNNTLMDSFSTPYFKQDINDTPLANIGNEGVIIYSGDTKDVNSQIVNAVAYENGVIIAARSNGTIVKIGYSGDEEVLLELSGASQIDWRGLFMDSRGTVFASPHASVGTLNVSDRGIYKLSKDGSSFSKVYSLYNTESEIETETQDNDDTIWTFCEDKEGNLYAGVYAHTKRANPSVYKSIDGGNTWTHLINFNNEGFTTNGRHIHTIIYNKYNDSLYVIVGEVNTIFKSTDGGNTWVDLHITLTVKGSSMIAVPCGILVGSDGAFHCDIDMILSDDKTHVKVSRIWANTVFAIRQSDITGYLYAFTKIDSSVNVLTYFPPIEAIDDEEALNNWKESQSSGVVNTWQSYHDSIVDFYPDDAIRPQHCCILISKDFGKTWKVLHRIKTGSGGPFGFWTTGYFRNGECLTGYVDSTRHFSNPLIISEGKHKYRQDGIDLDGEIFIKTNSSPILTYD